MIDELVQEISLRLETLGVRGRARERVLAEVRDHLEEAVRRGDENPAASFGDPRRFARLVASQVATASTRRAALGAFGALAVVGTAYLVLFALVPAAGGWADIFGGHLQALGPVLGIATVVLPQVALVGGCLALMQAARIRREDVVGAAELALLRRRSNVALASAAATLVATAGFALDFAGTMAAWWTWLTLVTCCALLLPLGAASYLVSDSACPPAEPAGPARDVFDELAPIFRLPPIRRLDLAEHPWRLALLSASAVGCAAFVLGWLAEGDPASGLVRGAFEAVALLICFAALGRTLGLRRSNG